MLLLYTPEYAPHSNERASLRRRRCCIYVPIYICVNANIEVAYSAAVVRRWSGEQRETRPCVQRIYVHIYTIVFVAHACLYIALLVMRWWWWVHVHVCNKHRTRGILFNSRIVVRHIIVPPISHAYAKFFYCKYYYLLFLVCYNIFCYTCGRYYRRRRCGSPWADNPFASLWFCKLDIAWI